MKPEYECSRIAPASKLAMNLIGPEFNHEEQKDCEQNIRDEVQIALMTSSSAKPDAETLKKVEIIEGCAELPSTRRRYIEGIYYNISSKQVHRKQLEFVSMWLIKGTFKKEHHEDCVDVYTPAEEPKVSLHSKVVRCHVVYKIKQGIDGRSMLKDLTCSQGNEDDHKNEIFKYSSNATMANIGMAMVIAAIPKSETSTTEIKGVYSQSGPI